MKSESNCFLFSCGLFPPPPVFSVSQLLQKRLFRYLKGVQLWVSKYFLWVDREVCSCPPWRLNLVVCSSHLGSITEAPLSPQQGELLNLRCKSLPQRDGFTGIFTPNGWLSWHWEKLKFSFLLPVILRLDTLGSRPGFVDRNYLNRGRSLKESKAGSLEAWL